MDKTRNNLPLLFNGQKTKDCKPQTPNMEFIKNDVVSVDCKTLLFKKEIKGEFIFDSYDKYDNSVYITAEDLTTYNVLWSDMKLVSSPKQNNDRKPDEFKLKKPNKIY